MIGGYVSGNPTDSISVGYYQDGTLPYAGKVRNGFVPHTRRAIAAKLRGLSAPPPGNRHLDLGFKAVKCSIGVVKFNDALHKPQRIPSHLCIVR